MNRTEAGSRLSSKLLIEECKQWIKSPADFYKCPQVKSKNITTDSDESYTEIIAAFLLENNHIDALRNIVSITREKTYIRDNHKGVISNQESDDEEIIAMRLYNQTNNETGGHILDYIGRIVDYQTPLKNKNDTQNKGVGKIDIISVNEDTSAIYILELKGPQSDETMLRCVLEGYTYYKRVNVDKLKKDLRKAKLLDRDPDLSDYRVYVAPLVFKDTQPYNEEVERLKGERRQLNYLISELNDERVKIQPFYLEKEEGIYVCHSFK